MKYNLFFSLLVIFNNIFILSVSAQRGGNLIEKQPNIYIQECYSSPSFCKNISSSVTIDANWRWLHKVGGNENCFNGNDWNYDYCHDPLACAQSCVLESLSTEEYNKTYGINTFQNSLSLQFVTSSLFGDNVGSRVFLMENENKYKIFKLLNKEFTFEVDDSQLECGLNGAVYFVEMQADGGEADFYGNKAGAKYGTGYCDAQCPRDLRFVNGEANLQWNATEKKGKYGSCCAEMDIWEANKFSTAFTPHPCSISGQKRCEERECGDGEYRYKGVCDKDGCDYNSYRLGNHSFYGPGKIVDTNKKITVITQFITNNNTDNGDLVEIRRLYKQDGKIIYNSAANFDGLNKSNSITDSLCNSQKELFGDSNHYTELGGLKEMGEAMRRGMVLTLSLWADHESYCLWLDSNQPADADPEIPGVSRGPCPVTSGRPADLQLAYPSATVQFSNIKFGPIGSTFGDVSYYSPPNNVPTQNACPAGKEGCECNKKGHKCEEDLLCIKGICKEEDISEDIKDSSLSLSPISFLFFFFCFWALFM